MITHHIQRFILNVLRHSEYARFTDLRPPNTDSNLFSYHLSQLLKQDYVKKTELGYTLSVKGITYVDGVSKVDTRPRKQPKIMTITIVENNKGEVLVVRKVSQPMINRWTFPCGMLHMDDVTIESAAVRELHEKVGLNVTSLTHIGDCYMAVRHEQAVLMNALLHVFTCSIDSSSVSVMGEWKRPEALRVDSASATARLSELYIQGALKDKFFFEFVQEL